MQQGEVILAWALEAATRAFGERLTGAYALGSLAHGGFDPLVSDVDFALVLADPLQESDAAAVDAINASVKPRQPPLSERLSIFWGSPASLRGDAPGGRFPPYDRADLLLHGRLLAGRDARAGLPLPEQRELVVAAARFALEVLGTPQAVTEVRNPEALVARGARQLTKHVLFPVRFLYTARTGKVGTNQEAVQHYLAQSAGGAVASLVDAALRWRIEQPAAGAAALARAGLVPLYLEFIDDHERRLRAYGESEGAGRLATWRTALAG